MPRPSRLILSGVPLHITQRGVDRCATFLAADDYAFYLWALREACVESHCAVHAYVLMTNHVHLLLTPADPLGPSRLMQSLGRRYVRYFNGRYGRTGTLWEGRFRSALVSSVAYFFACSRYIELNPVRAALVGAADDYPWSSYRHNAWGEGDPIVTPHAEYAALATSRVARCAAYRALFLTELTPREAASVRTALLAHPQLQETPYQRAVGAIGIRSLDPERGGTAAAGRVDGGAHGTSRSVPAAQSVR